MTATNDLKTPLSWKGIEFIDHIFVFGASNSAFHRKGRLVLLERPTKELPLGTKWPGDCYCEPGSPNWVGHLVASTQARGKNPPLLVHNYAFGGALVHDIVKQVDEGFMPEASQQPDWASWTAETSLFVIYGGGNDCSYIDAEFLPNYVDLMMSQVEKLYQSGARNFLFLGVAPIDRYPSVRLFNPDKPEKAPTGHLIWNKDLGLKIESFRASHPLSSIFFFSSFDFFNRILDEPAKYGLDPEDVDVMGGSIWSDHVHPTSAVHRYMALEVEALLRRGI